MAGDWIPIDVSLPGKPEVARLSALLGKPIDEVLGMLIRFWIWCQAHTADGHLSGMDTAMISAVSHVPERFLGALQTVGWLQVTNSGCFIPNFERWLSRGAKRRLQDRQRKRNAKAENSASHPQTFHKDSAKVPQIFRKNSASKAEKKRTTEEKRREYNNPPYIPPLERGGKAAKPPLGPLEGREAESEQSQESVPVSQAIQQLHEAWHSIPELPRIRSWSHKRRQALRTRLRDPTWLSQALEALQRIRQGKCPFLVGDNPRGWRANLDWFLRPDTVTRILEGAYDAISTNTGRVHDDVHRPIFVFQGAAEDKPPQDDVPPGGS